jgi:hypothetical protein
VLITERPTKRLLVRGHRREKLFDGYFSIVSTIHLVYRYQGCRERLPQCAVRA